MFMFIFIFTTLVGRSKLFISESVLPMCSSTSFIIK